MVAGSAGVSAGSLIFDYLRALGKRDIFENVFFKSRAGNVVDYDRGAEKKKENDYRRRRNSDRRSPENFKRGFKL